MRPSRICFLDSLKSLVKAYPNGDTVNKILKSPPNSLNLKQEAKDLKILSLEHLLDSLNTREMKIGEIKSINRKELLLKLPQIVKNSLMMMVWSYAQENSSPSSTRIKLKNRGTIKKEQR